MHFSIQEGFRYSRMKSLWQFFEVNDLRYFRNDKLDLVNKEKQRFGFRKLSSGKIASVLLGVTIFGSFALNGQVV